MHTPPRDTPFRDRNWDTERTDSVSTPDYQQRRRAISWLGDGGRTRDSSIAGRMRNGGPGSDGSSRVGSLTEGNTR